MQSDIGQTSLVDMSQHAGNTILEGLCAQKKISRSDDRGYSATEAAPRRAARREEPTLDEEIRMPAGKKKYYN